MSKVSRERPIMGLDLAHGSPQSKTHKPHYAIVILNSKGRKIYETIDAPLRRVIRLIWEYRPQIIALDNVFELASTEHMLAKVFSLLPDDVEVIQSTLIGGESLDIREAARRVGIKVPYTKLNPLQTAEVAALIALKGYGTKIKAIEQKTKIIVAKGRSLGSGGSSAQRYKRGIRSAILRIVRRIKESLDQHGFSYDMMFRRSKGGFEGAIFIVYAPRSALRGVVKPLRTKSVRVVIRPIYKSVITFGEVQKPLKKRYVIVGLDPGQETGLAIIDLTGTPLALLSVKEFDRTSIISTIFSFGIPIMVATDKHPIPEAVKKLASTLGIPLFDPGTTLTTEEKEKLIDWLRKITLRDFTIKSTHIRDALAACVKVLQVHERKLREMERKILDMGLEVPLDELRKEVLEGKSIAEIIEKWVEKALQEEQIQSHVHLLTISQHEEKYMKRIKQLEDRIAELIREREILKEYNKKLQLRISELEETLEDLSREMNKEIQTNREIEALKERIRQLTIYVKDLENKISNQAQALSSMENLIMGIHRGKFVIIRKLKNLLHSSLLKIREELKDIKLLYVDNPYLMDVKALNELAKFDIVLVTSQEKDLSDFERAGIAIVNSIKPIYIGEEIVIMSNTILKLAEDARKRIKELRKRKEPELTLDKLMSIIEEYRQNIITERDYKVKTSES